ncbi:uncharacterized protein K02A2.6-like [Macrosteles quadrilineatus]|uniref:uncharacterized protein K02A2.6-like n=1 Tax=Macrosteles quadrilineatus TaxID=74068 RepID=UPI0023E19981|nr:uncharacterized protein K02A2.6-like [Macrosteles quadrilineatus]
MIKEETAKDPELQVLLHELKNSRKDSPYMISDNILFLSDRVVIPKRLQNQILNELHESHLGITKIKQLARRYVWNKEQTYVWIQLEGMDKDIERIVKSCEACAKVRHNPPKAPVHPWDQPDDNWERVHIDYAGPLDGNYFLMCVDAKSKWAEVRILRNAPSSAMTMALLENIFSVHGYPSFLVSDNATIFKSEEFINYCKERGIFQKFTAPNHPATNGLAERNIQTLKRRLIAAADDPTPITTKLQNIMFRYRATPLASGKTPAELYLNRKIRIRLDTLLPNPKAKLPSKSIAPLRVRSLKVGERVQARVHLGNKDIWQFGTVKRKLGQYYYIVELDSGRSIKRHINQLILTLVSKKKVTFTTQNKQDSSVVPRRIPIIDCQEPPQEIHPESESNTNNPTELDGTLREENLDRPQATEQKENKLTRPSRQRKVISHKS